MKDKKGFTLIEVLVVVLIIGILAAIALPQYKKTQEKAEASELLINIKALHDAQHRFYLIHGEYATNFDDLDITFSGYQRNGCEHLSDFSTKTDCLSNDNNTIHMTNNANLALRKTGQYKMSGITVRNISNENLSANKLMCYEYKTEGFCSKVFNCNLIYQIGNNRYYSCPF